MNRTAVESSTLRAVGYDPAAEVMEVEFKNGKVYRYSGVPSRFHGEMMAATSVGKFFAANVRNQFPFSKL